MCATTVLGRPRSHVAKTPQSDGVRFDEGMEFGVLGPLVVTGTAQDGSVGGPKQRSLVALLLLNTNRSVSRDDLIAGIWGEHPPATAEHTLDNYLSRLRKILGPDRILRRREGYALRVEPEELDLDGFEAGLSEGMRLATLDPAAAAECLSAALAFWRGPALADLVDQPFATEAAARLEQRRLLAVEEYAAVMLTLGRADEVIELVEPLVVRNPFRERLRGQLIRGLYLVGRQERALAVYADARRAFAEELGIEPGEDLQRLHRAVLAHDPDLQPEHSRTHPADEPAPPPRRPPRSRWHPPPRVLALAAAVLGLVVATAIILPSSQDRSPATGPEFRTVRLDQTPSAGAAGFGALWLAMPARSEVVRVDAGTGQVSDHVPVGGAGVVAVSDHAVWSASVPGDAVDQIDPAAGTVVRTIGLGSARVRAMAFGEGALWVADAVNDAVIELDPTAGLVKRRMPLPLKPTSLIVDGETLWVADYANAEVAQVDASSGRIVARLHVGGGPTALALGSDALWVVNSLDSTVSRIDPQVSVVVATIPVGSGPVGIAATHGEVWVANQYSASMTQVDANTNTVITTSGTEGDPATVSMIGNTPWVATAPDQGGRGGTLRLLHSRSITLDPAFQTDLLPLMSDRLLRSTLVAYRHVSGPAGTQVVPDLAVAVPTPSGNATSFAFRLRPGIIYSDGRPLVASDFRRGLERVVALQTGNSANFMNIKGAGACARAGDESCDLSNGIDTDDAAGAVVFHLTKPDPDFVALLTEFAAAPIPPDTAYRDMGLDPIPGTGPYVVASASPDQVRYVRNPHFNERSHSAQPDGLADEIILALEESREKQTAAVLSGRADWAAYIDMNQLSDLRVEIPERIHRASIPTTDFFQFNLRLAPFDDIRVRQALNLAVDRDRIVELYGGPELATPTCQVLPPGIPAYRPFCPYTMVPTKSGAWREPDLRRARQLVAASGTHGAKVTVWGFTDDPTIRPEVVQYVASVLRKLGYDVSVRLESQDSDLPLDRIQIISGAWGRDTAHGMLTTWFTCDGATSHGYFCDPKVDSELRRARATVATDPREAQAIWASLDRYVTEQAGWMPMISEGGVEIVSDRLGNYQFNPYWGFIVDQASVR